MRGRQLLVLFLVLRALSGFSQNEKNRQTEAKYFDFVDEYNNYISETDTIDQEDLKEVVVVWPDTLPGWFFSPLNGNMIIGISDPGLDSLQGFRQALHRANLIASFHYDSHIGFITDNYKKETGREKSKIIEIFGQFFKTISKSPHISNFDIVEYHITKFGETVVLINPDTTKPITDSTVLITESLLEEKISGEAADIRFKYMLTSGIITGEDYLDVMQYSVKGINRHSSISSVFHRDSIQYPETRCKYYYKSEEMITDSAMQARKLVPIYLDYGLWNAYMQSLLRKVYHEVFRAAEVKVSKLSDDYNNRREHLKRELTRDTFRIGIKKIHLKNRQLIVDLEIIQ